MFDISSKIKEMILVSLICGYTFLLFAFWQLPDGVFHIYFLDVGQGDAIFIQTPENHQILVDGGPQSIVIEELADIMPFFDKTIDFMVLTHPHADHIDGLVEVLKRYEVRAVLFSGVVFENQTYEEFLNEIFLQEIPVFVAESGVDFLFGDVVLDVVHPIEQIVGESFKNLNNSSVGMRVLYNDVSIMLAGDMEAEAEKEVLAARINIAANILKAGHHGSKTASSVDFLRKVNPDVAVIQCGEGNSFGHPHNETLEKFAEMKVFRNDLDGRVEFVF